jgi:hypothetical protein
VLLTAVLLVALPTLGKADISNLIQNPGNEMTLVGGNIPDWTEIKGNTWTQRSTLEGPPAFEGSYYFFAGAQASAELAQVIDVSAWAATIDARRQAFDFQGYVRSYDQYPPDTARTIVEYLNAAQKPIISFDSGEIGSRAKWELVSDSRIAPVGTRDINVRLISTRGDNGGSNNDGYYDALSLETHVVPLPGAVVLGGVGLSFAGWLCRRRVA